MRRTHGFSLVELLCAIVILAVGIVGLTQGITSALSSAKESEVQTTAALLASSLIESLRAEGILTDGTSEGTFGEGLPAYSWSQTISTTAISGLHRVEVTVSREGAEAPVMVLETLLFEAPSTNSLSYTSGASRNP